MTIGGRACPGLVPQPGGALSRPCGGRLWPVEGGRGRMGRCARCGYTGPLSVHTVAPPLSDPPEPEIVVFPVDGKPSDSN